MAVGDCISKNKKQGKVSLLYVEIKPQLQIAQIILNVDKSWSECTVVVGRNGIHILTPQQKSLCNIVLRDVTLKPESCCGLRWVESDGLHLRVQIVKESVNLPKQCKADDVPEPQHISVLKSGPVTSCCRRCENTIMPETLFSSVLPLPSEGWQDLTDSWFCHCQHNHNHQEEHTHEEENLTPDLQPRGSKECLASFTCITVHSSAVLSSATTVDKSGCIQCRRCRAYLGSAIRQGSQDAAVLQFNSFAVKVESAVPSLLPSAAPPMKWPQHCEYWLSAFLMHTSDSNGTCRLLLESSSGSAPSTPRLMLWVLNSCDLLYQGSTKDKHATLDPQPILKAMFKSCQSDENKRMGISWRSDFNVHVAVLPADMCVELLHCLTANMRSVPASLRSANEFSVGFLRKEPDVAVPVTMQK